VCTPESSLIAVWSGIVGLHTGGLFSFIFISILFGLEHHRWLVGIAAGMIYAGVLYKEKNLFAPILSHALTNLLLGVYVLYTRQWSFW